MLANFSGTSWWQAHAKRPLSSHRSHEDELRTSFAAVWESEQAVYCIEIKCQRSCNYNYCIGRNCSPLCLLLVGLKVQIVAGEILESLWSVLNKVSPMTRTATLAHRAEILDDHMNDSNFKKMLSMRESLLCKCTFL